MISIQPHAQQEALRAIREREKTDEFKREYAKRAGVESTLSQGVRAFELRRSRYVGLQKTHLQHVATATAMSLVRVLAWLGEGDDHPVKKTPKSRFAALAPAA